MLEVRASRHVRHGADLATMFDPYSAAKLLYHAHLGGYRAFPVGHSEISVVDWPFGNPATGYWADRLRARAGDIAALLREYGPLYDQPPERE